MYKIYEAYQLVQNIQEGTECTTIYENVQACTKNVQNVLNVICTNVQEGKECTTKYEKVSKYTKIYKMYAKSKNATSISKFDFVHWNFDHFGKLISFRI